MKRTIFCIAVAAAFSASAQTYVAPYIKSDGTLVQGHYRSDQNSTSRDNYSTQGNSNPYTGERGSANPYNQAERAQDAGRPQRSNPYGGSDCGYSSSGRYICR